MEVFSSEIIIESGAPVGEESDLGLLRHLEALTYDFRRDGQDVSAVLTYAEPDPEHEGRYRAVVAADTGYEGIACLDDTARAALLALGIYERSGEPEALALARRWLTFASYMQYPDGDFANFIRNGSGIRNVSGPTSRKGGHAWTMRALWALARACRLTGDKTYLQQFQLCSVGGTPDLRTNSVLALADLELYEARPTKLLRERILERLEPVVESAKTAGYFLSEAGNPRLQLWGYHQLQAVAAAARILGERRFLASCEGTVDTLIEADVADRFWYSYPQRERTDVCAYNVSPIVMGLAELHRATGDERCLSLALQGIAWFQGRNEAEAVMFDAATGLCRDGITNGIASENYGAESSIEAGLAELERRRLLELP
ncbi:MAG: hypothetical protein ACRDFS_07760 [Chloroflexota bacterium]